MSIMLQHCYVITSPYFSYFLRQEKNKKSIHLVITSEQQIFIAFVCFVGGFLVSFNEKKLVHLLHPLLDLYFCRYG